MDKVKIDGGTITEGAETGLGKILLAAKKVNIGGKEFKVKKPK